MAGASSPRPDDHDCLRLPAASSPRTRGAEKKESTALRLSQPCPPDVTQSSISSFGRRLNGVRTAENKSLKNNGANNFCQSSANKPPDCCEPRSMLIRRRRVHIAEADYVASRVDWRKLESVRRPSTCSPTLPARWVGARRIADSRHSSRRMPLFFWTQRRHRARDRYAAWPRARCRSEEHTSELQSRFGISYAV